MELYCSICKKVTAINHLLTLITIAKEEQQIILCCPEMIKDDHCDVISFSRVLTYPIDDLPVKKMWGDVKFEYTGMSSLTVTGGITGKRYRFNYAGDVQVIDYRDAGWIMGCRCCGR